MVPASGSPPEVAAVLTASLPKVTVVAGDTLSGIAARTARTWPQLWKWNHIPNPDLIYVGQVVEIPAASYNPGSYAYPVSAPAPTPSYTPPAPTHTYASTRTYTPAPRQTVVSGGNYASGGSGVWGCIGQHESGNNPATNTGNGYYGAFQDTISAWRAGGGGPGLPSNYSYSEQLRVNENLQAQVGWGAWPNTSRICGA